MSKAAKIIIVIVLIAAIVGVVLYLALKTSYLEPVYRIYRSIGFSMDNKKSVKGETVFVGDSITDGCDLEKYYPDYVTANRGISGDDTTGLLKRMDESIFDLQPKTVVLLIGINDVSFFKRDAEYVKTNIDKILGQIKEKLPETRVIVQSLYPVYEGDWKGIVDRCKDKIPVINEGIKELAEKYGYTYADVNSLLSDENGLLKHEYSDDGLHPNAKGYEVISAYLNTLLADNK